MPEHVYKRKKNTAIAIASLNVLYFPLVQNNSDTVPLPAYFNATPATFVAADTQYSIDGGAFANTAASPVHEGLGIYSLELSAAEVNGNCIMVTIRDQSVPRVWVDVALRIETFCFLNPLDELEGTEAINADFATSMSFRKILQFLKARFLYRATQTAASRVLYKADSSTVLLTQAVSYDTVTQSQSKGV